MPELFFSIIFISRLILQKISRLAVQGLAEGGQGREAHGLRLACLEDGQVRLSDSHLLCQLSGGHLPLCQHYVYVYYDWHDCFRLDCQVVFFAGFYCELMQETKDDDKQRADEHVCVDRPYVYSFEDVIHSRLHEGI